MPSSRLPVPIRDLLDERLRESDVKRVWKALEAKRAPRRSSMPSRRWLIACASALIGAALAVLWMRAPAPSSLRLADGHDVPSHLAAKVVSFDDGSSIDERPGARVDLLESTGRAFSVALRTGTAAFEVHPGGPRVWQVVCGPVTVEVVGTHFMVTRNDAEVRVSVERGAVLVKGEPVPDHVVRLGASQSIVVPLTETATGTAPAQRGLAPAPAETAPAAAPDVPARQRTAVAASSNAPLPPADVASAEPSTEPPPAPAPAMDALLASADEARVAGRYAEAASLLERVVAKGGGGPQTSLAEFSLGRLYLDSLGAPARAAGHFSRALTGALPGALAEDAYARLVEAYARAGDAARAREVAERYRSAYPGGRRRHDVDRWSAPSP